MNKTLLEQLPEIVRNGKRRAERISINDGLAVALGRQVRMKNNQT